MLALLEDIVEWVRPAFEHAGYWIVFGGVLLEHSVLLGLIVPGDILLALGGVYAARGQLRLEWLILGGAIAAPLSDTIGYWLGRKYGKSLLLRLPLLNRLGSKVDKARAYFGDHGGWTVALGRYATAAGAFVPFAAGMSGMPYPKFLLFELPSAIAFVVAVALLGYFFGQNLAFIEDMLSRFGWAALALLAGVLAWRWWRKRREGGSGSKGK